MKVKSQQKKWREIHHKIWRILNQNLPQGFKKKPFLVCVSGGADSVALFHLMKALPIQMQVFHAHHGDGENKKFRDQAEEFVKSLCQPYQISLIQEKAQIKLKSENDFRQFRIQCLKKWKKENPDGIIVMAHHSQDLIETRIMRLIRGTGPDGIRSMQIWKDPVLRPFLELTPKELREFLKSEGYTWCEDPSNQNTVYFRNWIRHRWLPLLEKARPGSLNRLSQSLEHLSDFQAQNPVISDGTLSRTLFVTLNQKEQLQQLGLLLKSQGVTHFTSGQLKEVIKRLDNSQTRLIFKAAGALWTVNAQQIFVEAL